MARHERDDPDLTGVHILLIEDEHIVAAAFARALAFFGAEIVGPAATVEQALALIASAPRIDGAVLDVNLRGVRAFGVADELAARGVPFVFATGYSALAIPERYRAVPTLVKPFEPRDVASALFPPEPRT
jgi:CheY-like chemotaxis protein